MARFHVGDSVHVLITWSALGEQVGTVLDVVDQSHLGGEELYLVKFQDRELGPASSRRRIDNPN